MTNSIHENPVSHKMQVLSRIGSEIRNTFMLGQQLTAQGFDIIDLSLGNPDLEPPLLVKEKMQEVLSSEDANMHRYTDSAGLLDVREFLAKELTQSENVHISAQNVYLTVGAAGALQICMRTFLHDGDEVIIFSPYFPEYLAYAHHFNATPIVIDSDANHIPHLDQLEQKITSNTKLVILNSPNNPSGVYYSQVQLEKIFSILNAASKRFNRIIPVISDEPYTRLLYTEPNPSMLALYPHTFLVRSLSKDLGLAGERIGYFVWRADIYKNSTTENLLDIFRNAGRVLGFVSAPRFMQRIIPHVFHSRVDIDVYKQRVDTFLEYIQGYGLSCVRPSAGFFIFPELPKGKKDLDVCLALAQKGLLCVPGSAFGKPGYVRISLTQPIAKIKAGAEIYGNVLSSM